MFSGIGTTEFFILIAMALVLFGLPSLVAFWIGYKAGSKRSGSSAPKGEAPVAKLPAEKPDAPSEADAQVPEPSAAPPEEETPGD